MAKSAAARPYAQAMIEIAAEAGILERVEQDLERFSQLWDEHEGLLAKALGSPVFTTEERRAVLQAVLPKLELHGMSANLIHLANDKGRLLMMREIAEAYRELADERAGRLRVLVQTAEPLSADLEAEVVKALSERTGKTIVLRTEVDESLIGGMVARVGGKVYDSSIRNRLSQMKDALLSGSWGGATPAEA